MKNKHFTCIFGNVLLVIGIMVCSACSSSRPNPVSFEIGEQLPGLDLPAVQGGHYALDQFDNPILLSFISDNSDSRSQVVFLRSMWEQYQTPVLIVNTSDTAQSELLNRTYDWQFYDIPFLMDDGSTSHRFGVNLTPTTYLVSPDGVVLQRWEGFASAPQLALSLQSALGLDIFGTPVTSSTCNETASQAIFSGLPLARAFAENLWVADGGQTWGEGMPIHWLTLVPQNSQVYLGVRFIEPETGVLISLVEIELEPLSAEETQALLSEETQMLLYHTIQPITQLPDADCIEVTANITVNDISSNPLYVGTITVPVESR